MIKNEKEENLQTMKEFYDLLQVLLISYMNLGMIKFKQNDLKYATKVFQQGWRLSKKFFGPDANFSVKFK